MLYLGEAAAVITSITFAINSALFTLAGREVGSLVVNRLRLIAASFFLIAAHWIFLGTPWPTGANFDRWFWLGLSGIVGLVLGDAFLFQAFVWVGPRISMLMMSLAPILAAFTAWIFLGEALTWWQLMGIFLTIIGVMWVVLERNQNQGPQKENYLRGILFGLGGAIGQALGSPISGNFIRMFTAMIVIWLITIIQRQARTTIQHAIAYPDALWKIIGGAFTGPFLGVCFYRSISGCISVIICAAVYQYRSCEYTDGSSSHIFTPGGLFLFQREVWMGSHSRNLNRHVGSCSAFPGLIRYST